MMIAINGKFRRQPLTGVQRYATELSERLLRRPGYRLIEAANAGESGWVTGTFWEQLRLPTRLARGESLWSPGNVGPLVIGDQVVTIHDTSFIDHPESCTRRFGAYYRALVPRLAGRCRGILTVSEFAKTRIVETMGVPPEKVMVAPNGVGQGFTEPQPHSHPRFEAGADRFILAVGTLQPRKNLRLILRAWPMIRAAHPGIVLKIVGARQQHFKSEDGLPSVIDGIEPLGYVDDETLRHLYRSAVCLVFPSRYEGFGLPPLEAMASGCPVVTSNATSLPEVVGDAGLYFDPDQVEELIDQVKLVLGNDDLRQRMAVRGIERAADFTWDHSADCVDKCLRLMLGR